MQDPYKILKLIILLVMIGDIKRITSESYFGGVGRQNKSRYCDSQGSSSN
jgi:hypothetical protein